MDNQFFEKPILNSPYEYPSRYWELDDHGQPTQQIIESRRLAKFVTPIPKPKKRKGQGVQSSLLLDDAGGHSTQSQEYEKTASMINAVRLEVDKWRRFPNANDWRVTPETARLLQHWRHHKFSGIRPFFCQVEAVETAIWLTEVAPQSGKAGERFLEHLANASHDANPAIMRLALKLATGAGKTTVMAMLIAWQTINAVRKPNSKEFTRGFLIVAPGITIRDRLRVLHPNDPDSYYKSRELIPKVEAEFNKMIESIVQDGGCVMSNIKLFESSQIRSIWSDDDQKWYFSVVDVVAALTESPNPRDYWYRIKQREKISGIELSTICRQFKLEAPDGKLRETDCSHAEGLLRIIQSIPSPKAEPFKRWLAKVGYERLEEIENPELAAKRMRELYKAKGYSDEWIEKRVRGVAIRDELTNEWQKRGVKEQREYAILTAEISRATFGMSPAEYKAFKSLAKPADNLRDHMTDLELIFTMLGEASTTEIARNKDARGYEENREAAVEGGKVAGSARLDLEQKSGRRVSSKENYKAISEAVTRKRLKKKG